MKKEKPTLHYSVLEERLKASKELKKKLMKDEGRENAKNHFNEIFNRI